jgi:hypothetical protein
MQSWAMAWGIGAMAQQVCVVSSAAEREQLAAIVADRNRPRKHVERARIVNPNAFAFQLLTAVAVRISFPPSERVRPAS